MNTSQISSIDFVINRFFMKMFNTNNIEIVKCCQLAGVLFQSTKCHFGSPHRFFKAKLASVRIFLSKDSCVCKLLYFAILGLPAIDVFILTRVSIRVSDCMCVQTAVFHRLFVKLDNILVKLLLYKTVLPSRL